VKGKVLIIVENAPAPPDPRVWKEALALRDAGYEVRVLCPRRKGYLKGYELKDGIHIYRHPMPNGGNSIPEYLWEYGCALFWEFLYSWWIYLRRGFQVIQGCNPPDDIFLVALPFKLLGVKFIFDHHDVNPELYLAKYDRRDLFYRAMVWLEKLTFHYSDAVISTNESYKEIAVTRGNCAPDDVFVVRNGPDLKTFKAVPANPSLKHGKRFLVGYVGVMGAQDSVDILLDVADYIRSLGRRDIHFTCIGTGPAMPKLIKMHREKNLGDMVNFTGRIPDRELLEILSTADVCVNPDKPCRMNDISTMIKIMEYMALGKPIVQFDLKEGRVSAQEASLYSDTGNQVEDFAQKILWLVDHPEERRRMGEAGRKRVETELAWDYSVAPLLAAYEKVFRESGGTHASEVDATQGLPDQREASREGTIQNLIDRFRVPEAMAQCSIDDDLCPAPGFFQLGKDVICFGRCSSGRVASSSTAPLFDVWDNVSMNGQGPCLPFDPDEVVEGLLYERAFARDGRWALDFVVRTAYYALRPLLITDIRKHFQRIYMTARSKATFPAWPLDWTVERLLETLLMMVMRAQGIRAVPFIWFWPDGCSCAAMLTHDVETARGRDFCPRLMDLDESAGIQSSFQLVPEKRYSLPEKFLASIRERGFEINIHDLNHDGRLFVNHEKFLRRAKAINQYGKSMGARGFRSGAMYRNLEWFGALDFEYDMSVPNVGRWEAQFGGCCTVMPYFVGTLLELPLNTVQDYVLFDIWGSYSIDLWKKQAGLIRDKHGLISLLVHPDYVMEPRAMSVYQQLLDFLRQFRAQENVWFALPGEVNDWWRQRARMSLVEDGQGNWRIEGMGSERARLAFAELSGDSIVYRVEEETSHVRSVSQSSSL
jgi:glycosyltransferase involved in cell wall biosynthesis